ncbi:MAG: type III-B CRISPR module-associated protein Cmr3 [Thermodesulfobacteriota bacterium]|nr:MAG: type III-B CRISPR module-associated protein Cmr3 [Thermodesulfobacteriota bacterium]
MIKFKIEPFDVLFFGSGRPFNLGDTASSIFPPLPHTLAGAISSKIYEKGIKDYRVLKKIIGPFLFNEDEKKFYFPKPADICRKRKEKNGNIYLLSLFKGNTRLFKSENTNKPGEIDIFSVYYGSEQIEFFKGFISKEGLKDWLEGKIIDKKEIKLADEIFKEEKRIGIKQDMSFHTVVELHGLYRIDFIRLKENWSLVLWVEFDCEVLNKNEDEIFNFFNDSVKVLKLGGEMKAVRYEIEKVNGFNFFEKPKLENNDIIKILFLTPGIYDSFIPKIDGVEIKSIICEGYLNVGLHSLRLNKKRVMKKSLPSGTVIYGQVEDKEKVKNLWLSSSDGSNGFIGSNLIIYGKQK